MYKDVCQKNATGHTSAFAVGMNLVHSNNEGEEIYMKQIWWNTCGCFPLFCLNLQLG